jgi:heme/copper-type cytochrome/quinol oxidase subunit 3
MQHAHAHAHPAGGEPPLMAHGSVLQTGITNGKIAMWLFLGSEVMFFTGLIGAYVILRFGAGTWADPTADDYPLNIPLTAANTFLLICSSVSLVWGLQGYQTDNIKQGNLGLLLTTIFGAVFVGVQMYEYVELANHGMLPSTDIFGSCFYIMTGFHGLHVAIGVVTLAVLTVMGYMGKFNSSNYAAVENSGLYWHFVDLVWIILFAIVYLI